MTDDELDRLQAMADAASPPPWEAAPPTGYSVDDDDMEIFSPLFYPGEPPRRKTVVGGCGCCGSPYGVPGYGAADRAFICAARTALPALLAEVKRLRAEVARQAPGA